MRWIMVPGITNFFDKYVDNNFSLRRRAGEFTKNILFQRDNTEFCM